MKHKNTASEKKNGPDLLSYILCMKKKGYWCVKVTKYNFNKSFIQGKNKKELGKT